MNIAQNDIELTNELLARIVSDQKKKAKQELEEAKVFTYQGKFLTYVEAKKVLY